MEIVRYDCYHSRFALPTLTAASSAFAKPCRPTKIPPFLYNQKSMPHTPLTIGVLALQGAFEAHAKALTALGATAKLVRTTAELADIDGLIIPGGESTTFLKFLERGGFLDALQSFVETTPTFGTCAGAILLAKNVENPTQKSLAALDITVERNAYGRQIDSTILTELSSDTRVHQLFLDLVRNHKETL